MPSAMLLMLIVKLKQVLFHSLNRNIHSRLDVLLRACPKNDKFAKKMSRGSTAILLLYKKTLWCFNEALQGLFIYRIMKRYKLQPIKFPTTRQG